MKFALAEQIRKIDAATQNKFMLSGDLLMETAALLTANFLGNNPTLCASRKVLVCCGKGNNGGDGLALSRILASRGYEITVFLPYEETAYRDLAELNLQRLKSFGGQVQIESDFSKLPSILANSELAIDALLGTGTFGEPREPLTSVITALNASRITCVALDLPTGIDPDFGRVSKSTIRAGYTVTFGLGKPGLYSYPGAEFAGEVNVLNIGFPPSLIAEESLRFAALEKDEARTWLPNNFSNMHKGQKGHLLVIGGSEGMTGAPVMSSLAAFRTGCGLVTLALRDGLIAPEKPPEVMLLPWNKINTANKGNYQAIVCGPGLGTAPDAAEMLNLLLNQTMQPLVLDADALNLLAASGQRIPRNNRSIILTPHPGEMARLTGLTVAEVQADRLHIAEKYAKEQQVIVVLKGARTVIALPDGRVFLNLTGSPALATAGTGDVLAGIIGSLLAQGLIPERAAILGPYLHGLAGEEVAEKVGSRGSIAGDLFEALPKVYQKLEGVSVEKRSNNSAGLG